MPKAKTPKKPTLNRSDFIRSQPASMSATEIVSKAKEAGIKFLPQLVYKVRGAAKAKGKAKKTAAANAPAGSAKTGTSKSDFIRQQPSTLSAAEVVAKAKTAGMTILPGLVYEVRRKAKARATAKAKKSPAVKNTAVSAKMSSAATKPVKSKAAFVRGLPASTPAKDVVKQAKALGMKLEVSYVYNVRGAAKKAVRERIAASPAVANGGGSRVSTSAENLLKAVAAEIGLGPAIEILSGERARVAAVLRG